MDVDVLHITSALHHIFQHIQACFPSGESVVTLSKGEIDCETVMVDFSLEEFDMASIVNDPTYPKIKEYVLEHTGLKVSSLYIAQVKKKCGLEVGECYNKPKSENSKTSVCPPEKEQAIMDAFRYFGMI